MLHQGASNEYHNMYFCVDMKKYYYFSAKNKDHLIWSYDKTTKHYLYINRLLLLDALEHQAKFVADDILFIYFYFFFFQRK